MGCWGNSERCLKWGRGGGGGGGGGSLINLSKDNLSREWAKAKLFIGGGGTEEVTTPPRPKKIDFDRTPTH